MVTFISRARDWVVVVWGFAFGRLVLLVGALATAGVGSGWVVCSLAAFFAAGLFGGSSMMVMSSAGGSSTITGLVWAGGGGGAATVAPRRAVAVVMLWVGSGSRSAGGLTLRVVLSVIRGCFCRLRP